MPPAGSDGRAPAQGASAFAPSAAPSPRLLFCPFRVPAPGLTRGPPLRGPRVPRGPAQSLGWLSSPERAPRPPPSTPSAAARARAPPCSSAPRFESPPGPSCAPSPPSRLAGERLAGRRLQRLRHRFRRVRGLRRQRQLDQGGPPRGCPLPLRRRLRCAIRTLSSFFFFFSRPAPLLFRTGLFGVGRGVWPDPAVISFRGKGGREARGLWALPCHGFRSVSHRPSPISLSDMATYNEGVKMANGQFQSLFL